jgi:hypothetical protein
MKSLIKGKSKLMSEPEPAPEREPEPKLFESRSRSGNKKFRLHNTACKGLIDPFLLSNNYIR